jgi:hypothetical protein
MKRKTLSIEEVVSFGYRVLWVDEVSMKVYSKVTQGLIRRANRESADIFVYHRDTFYRWSVSEGGSFKEMRIGNQEE